MSSCLPLKQSQTGSFTLLTPVLSTLFKFPFAPFPFMRFLYLPQSFQSPPQPFPITFPLRGGCFAVVFVKRVLLVDVSPLPVPGPSLSAPIRFALRSSPYYSRSSFPLSFDHGFTLCFSSQSPLFLLTRLPPPLD